MVKTSKQQWEVGQQVNVGFIRDLTVVAAIPTPGDYQPDAYLLSRGDAVYSFVPHRGISKITPAEARELIADAKALAERVAKAAITKAAESARAISEIAMLAAEGCR